MASALRRRWQAFVASAQPFVSEALERAGIIAINILPGLLHFLQHLPEYFVCAMVALLVLHFVADILTRVFLTWVHYLLTLSWAIVGLLRYLVGSECPVVIQCFKSRHLSEF
jgi:hypothetical protein